MRSNYPSNRYSFAWAYSCWSLTEFQSDLMKFHFILIFFLAGFLHSNPSGISSDGQEKYITSSGKSFVPKSHYPKWNWDTVKEYKMFYSYRALSDSQVSKIASLSDFICIEKAHGVVTFNCAMLGTKHEATRLKGSTAYQNTFLF